MATAVETRGVRVFMRIGAVGVLAFLYLPLLVILAYAFNPAVAQTWPLSGLTTKWCCASPPMGSRPPTWCSASRWSCR